MDMTNFIKALATACRLSRNAFHPPMFDQAYYDRAYRRII